MEVASAGVVLAGGGGVEHASLPTGLIALQADWQRTYAALAVPPPVHATALRRRLYALSGQLLCHPYWSSPRDCPAREWS